MKQYNTSAVFVAACAGMAFFGVTMLSLGPIMGRIADLGVNATLLSPTLTLGIIIGTLLFGPIVDKFGYKGLIILSSVLALAGVLGLSFFSTDGLLQTSICSLGIGGGVLNGLTNALVSDIYEDDKRGARLSLLGACYCVGALLWTLLNYFIPDYHTPLYITSAVMVCFIIFFCLIAFPKAKPAENVSMKKTLGLFKYPALLMFGLVLFFQSGFEGASGDFTVTFLTKARSLDLASATLAMTWFTIGMLAGRLLLGSCMKVLKDLGTFFSYLTIALAGVAVLYFAGSAIGAYLAMALIGFGAGATFPVVLNYVGGTFRNNSGTAISIAVFIALVGQFTLKRITGAAFNAGSFEALPIVLAGAIVIMMCLVPVSVKVGKNTKVK
ncbi:MAG: MFS transporter [Bacteroidales bacterium]|nr:MFS transporter [Candidatus Cacconaster merdequi]